MKVLIISPEYPKETGVGGIAYATQFLAELMKENYPDIYITILSLSRKEYKREVENGIEIIRLLAKNNLQWYLKVTLWLIQNYSNYNYIEDTTFGANIFFAKLLLQKRLRYCARVHGTHYRVFVLEGFRSWFKKLKTIMMDFMEGYTLKMADCIITPSESKKELIFFRYGLDYNKIKVVGNVYRFHTNKRVNKMKNDNKKPYFLFLGRLQSTKGADILVQLLPHILHHYKDHNFLFVGKDTRNYRQLLIKDLTPEDKKRVIFIEHTTNRDRLYDIISNAQVFFIISKYESYGMVVVEAIDCLTPVLATKSGGIRELLTDGIDSALITYDELEDKNEVIRKLEFLTSNMKSVVKNLENKKQLLIKKNEEFLAKNYCIIKNYAR